MYPLILHQGQKPYACPTDLFDFFEENKEIARKIMAIPVQLFDLATASDEELKRFFWFGASALIAKHIKDPNILPTLKIVVELLHNIEVKEEREYITVHLKYIAEAADIQDEEEFREIIRRGLTSIDEENIMTLAEKWKQEGIQQGLQQGLEKGLEKGRLEVARSMLQKGLDTQVIMEVTGLSQAQISELLH